MLNSVNRRRRNYQNVRTVRVKVMSGVKERRRLCEGSLEAAVPESAKNVIVHDNSTSPAPPPFSSTYPILISIHPRFQGNLMQEQASPSRGKAQLVGARGGNAC